MRLPGVTGEVAGLWENSGSFGEVVNRFLRLCLSMCDTRPGWNCSLVINLGLAYPKILESMKGGSGETRSHYSLFNLMIICVAWSSQWRCQEVQFPWLGRSRLRGQEISLGSELWACSSCIPESGRHWCARVEKPHSWLGSPQGISSPFSAAFSPCLIPTSAMEAQSPQLTHAPPSPLAKHFSSSRVVGQGGNGAGRAPLTSRRHVPGVRPSSLLPQGGRGHGHIPPFSSQTPLLPVAPRSLISGTRIPLSAVGNHGLASWEGGSRGTGAPQGAALPAADGAGP